MVLTAPGLSLSDIYRFNSAIMFCPRPLYDETMSWTAPPRLEVTTRRAWKSLSVCCTADTSSKHTPGWPSSSSSSLLPHDRGVG